MSLKNNIITNYFSQAYVALIGIIMVPVYLKYMGVEAYGVVGFFAMAQAWMQLFDLGLSSTLGREASKFKAGTISAEVLKSFLNLLEFFFFFIGLIIITIGWGVGDWVANSWLKLETLSLEEVTKCVGLVSIILSCRLISGVYRGGLLGLEKQVSANIIAVCIATLKSIMVIPVLIWVSHSISTFFTFQLIVALIEVIVFKLILKQTFPARLKASFQWELLKEPLRFGLGMAFLTCVWIACSQVDKLILSHLLPMREYGEFILATTITMGVNLMISPLQQAILPRLTILVSQNQHQKIITLYRKTTLLIAAILSGVVGVIVTFPEQVLYAWVGDILIAKEVAEILKWYAIGSGFVGLLGMSYLMQHAHGELKLHTKFNLVVLCVLIPSIIYSTFHYGAIGAAIVWAAVNAMFLLIWPLIVHKYFLPEVRWTWLIKDVFPALFITFIIVFLGQYISWPLTSRPVSVIVLMMLAGLITVFLLVIRSETRSLLLAPFQKTIEKYA
jgi:O-antigen/teichoic acid export membrane protein